MFDLWVLSILVYVFMYMTYKLHLGRILSVGGSKLECWGKRVLKFEVFFWTVERSLKRALSEPQASVPKRFWTQFAWARCERSSKRTKMLLLSRVRLSEAQANPKRTRPEATKTWSLKRTSRRLSKPCPVQMFRCFRCFCLVSTALRSGSFLVYRTCLE